jgi:hypothetical protein
MSAILTRQRIYDAALAAGLLLAVLTWPGPSEPAKPSEAPPTVRADAAELTMIVVLPTASEASERFGVAIVPLPRDSTGGDAIG